MKHKMSKYILSVLFALPRLMLLLCFVLLLFGQHLYLPYFSTRELCYCSFCAIIFGFIICCGVDWCRDRQKWYKIMLKVFCTLLVILFVGLLILTPAVLSGMFGTFLQCDSPDGQHRLLFERQSTFAAEWGAVYEMTSPITMKKLSSLEYPFDPQYHDLVWHETYVELIYRGETLRLYYTRA